MKLLMLSVLGFSGVVWANPLIQTHLSPSGIQEECIRFSHLPGGDYKKGDLEEEEMLCGLDFYNDPSIALCPKTWSTSPGTMIYDISSSGKTQAEYESARACGGSKNGHETVTKFKQSMNQKGTSGTHSLSSIVYYHFSRFLDTEVKVPVAVYRTMSKDEHFNRVTKKAHEKRMGKGTQVRAGWEWMYKALLNPSIYKPISDLFTDDLTKIKGVLTHDGGERYREEINGLRSRWGDKQNEEFQETPAFYALRSDKPLRDAIQEGLELGQRNSKIRRAMGGGATAFQMAIWMRELSEIAILDHILNQQDRVGNVDFRWYIYWIDGAGKVKDKLLRDSRGNSVTTGRVAMAKINYPKEVDGFPTQLVQRTRITDNDAGVKTSYSNFAKRTSMVKKIRHLSPKTLRQLEALNSDLQSQGAVYQILKNELGLNEDELNLIVENTKEVVEILLTNQRDGRLLLDLDSDKDLFKALQ